MSALRILRHAHEINQSVDFGIVFDSVGGVLRKVVNTGIGGITTELDRIRG